ncbi:MAG: biotin--[acetyl-CoA-carboxylase] ligase [Dehalococcoidia bacterium]
MKDRILERLQRGGYVSGEELGRALGISRTAVWKHISRLKREGYRIHSIPSRGYCLASTPDRLFPQEIKAGLQTHTLGQEIIYFKEISSTQEAAKSFAERGNPEGTIIISEIQLGGKGRIGREWSSPAGGIYFSIILRPDIRPTEASRFPLTTGLAVARAIEAMTDFHPQLKWPNDVIVNDRKVCGILTDLSAEMDRLNWIVIGPGLNVNTTRDSFPREVGETATSLFIEGGRQVSRVMLLQGILYELESLYEQYQATGFEPIRERWKARSNTLGAQVEITFGAERKSGRAVDIDPDGALILQKDDGSTERIVAGDVSLRNVKRQSGAG